MSHSKEKTDGGELAGAEAVATVACCCDLTIVGDFRAIAMPAAMGEVEKCWTLHLVVWRRARTAALAGIA